MCVCVCVRASVCVCVYKSLYVCAGAPLAILGPMKEYEVGAPYHTHSATNIQVNLAIQNLCLQFNNTDLLLLLLLSTTRYQYLVRDLPWL